MNVIEALFITLGLDTREYEKNSKQVMASLTKMGEASKKQTDLIAESGKKAAHSFSLLKVEVLGALAAFGLSTGFKDFLQTQVAGNAALGRMSANLRMSASDLKAWGYAAQSVGGKADDAYGALQSIAGQQAQTKLTGNSGLRQANQRFGFASSAQELTGGNPAQILIDLARRAAAMHDRQMAMQMFDMAGVTNTVMQNMLLMGPDRVRALVGHYRGMTGHTDTKDATALQRTAADISASLGNLEDDLFSKMAPSLEVFAKKFEAFLTKATPKLEKLAERFGEWLASIDWDKVIAAIGRFIDKVQDVVKEMGGWKRVAEILGAVLALKVLSPIIGLVFNMAKLVPLLGGATAGVKALTAAMWLLGPAIAGVGGYYAGSKISDMFDKFEQYAFGDKDQTYGGALYDAFHKFNPKTGKVEFDPLGVFRTWGQFHADQAAQRAYQTGPHSLSSLPALSSRMAKQEEASAMQYLMSQGFTQAQAAGIVGNLMQESGMRAKAVGPDGKHFGLAQWGGSRIADFNDYAKSQGWNTNLQGSTSLQQLQFLVYEMHHKESRAYGLLKNTTDAAHAAVAMQAYERQGSDGTLGRRVRYAELANAAYPGAAANKNSKPATKQTNTVTIHELNVNAPKATDAKGVAAGLKTALQMNPLIAGYVTSLA